MFHKRNDQMLNVSHYTQLDLDEKLIIAVKAQDILLVNALINANANPNYLNERDESALLCAVKIKNLDIARRLLASDTINPNIRDQDDNTPLMFAVLNQIDMCKLLLKNGAAPDLQNKAGHTAVDIAKLRCSRDIQLIMIDLLEQSSLQVSRARL